jgi:hypothetical protein
MTREEAVLKVRQLLALAESTEYPDEAARAREHADRLKAAHDTTDDDLVEDDSLLGGLFDGMERSWAVRDEVAEHLEAICVELDAIAAIADREASRYPDLTARIYCDTQRDVRYFVDRNHESAGPWRRHGDQHFGRRRDQAVINTFRRYEAQYDYIDDELQRFELALQSTAYATHLTKRGVEAAIGKRLKDVRERYWRKIGVIPE